jgi:Na+-driven multidrug efflux pump
MAAMIKSEDILVEWFGQDPEVSSYVGEVLSIYGWSLPGLALRMVTEQLMFAGGISKPSMVTALSSFVAAGGLAGYLTFGKPNMGLGGIAIGFATEPYITAGLQFLYMLRFSDSFKDIPFLKNLFSNTLNGLGNTIKQIAKIGFPITLQLSGEIGAFMAVNMIAGKLGTKELAAQNFMTQLFYLAVFPRVAIGTTTAIFVGQSLGAGSVEMVKRYSRAGLGLNAGFALLLGIPLAIYPNLLGFLITNDPVDHEI